MNRGLLDYPKTGTQAQAGFSLAQNYTEEGAPDAASVTSADRYQQALSKAFEQIVRLDYRPNLMVWLRSHHLTLYRSIVKEYPERIEDSWAKKVPLILFESVLADWIRLFRAAVTLFREHGQRRPGEASESWTAKELEIEARTRPSPEQLRVWAARRGTVPNSKPCRARARP